MALVRAVGGRLVVFGVSLLLASLLIFVLTHALPGDPAIKILGTGADPTAIAELRHRLGLDRPASVQYLDWLGGFVTGDLGRSYTTNEPVAVLIAPRIGVTGWLCGISILLAPLVALPQGMLAAVKRRNWSGFAASALSQLGLAVPAFYAGILLVVVFAVKLHWLPANGYVELRDATGWWDWPGWAQHLVLPVLSLVLVFWVRGRLHEIGILLSIGTSKRQIIGQFLAELAIIALVSSVFALAIGSVASSQISTALTTQTNQSQRVEKTVVHAAPVATYLQAFAFGYMVVLLSAIAATAPIMRQSPKQILAKLS